MKTERRWGVPRPGTVIAVAALVVASAGSATAASLIGSSQVKNNSLTGADVRNSSLTGKDVKNRSLTESDLSKATVSKFRGVQGPAGPAGPQGIQGVQGAKGDQGEIGPSTAFSKKIGQVEIDVAADQDFAKFTLVPGAFVVTASFHLAMGLDPGKVTCSLDRLIGNDPLHEALDTSVEFDLASGDKVDVALHAAFTDATAFSYDITCTRNNTSFITVKDVQITAIKVGSITPLA